ncbi:chaplin [Streptomyces sp. CNQ-509]|uniref:chaplin n=1 Tax=unclassified Streptomyces TaxID=2593676 RepID=UPI00062E0205|nr:chaplin [Streptomyces sp. CNQ-509]AKH81668.1 chaplin [Streptomyces sp. CNQ-509]
MHAVKKAAFVLATAGLATGAGASAAVADAGAGATAQGSPGVVSGNVSQFPVHLPVNLVGNNITVVGLLNAPFGNTGVNA